MLALAHTIYEDGMHSCGFPKHICMHPDNDGYFELPDTRTICQAEAVIENKRKDNNWEAEPGESLFAQYTREGPLPALPPRRAHSGRDADEQ